MQHLDDANEQAEAWMAEWLTPKPRNWRALLVKDVLAKLRVILWCPDRSWESSRREIDEQLKEAASDYWSESVLRGRGPESSDGAWQEQAWSAARPHEATDRLRMLDRHLSKTGWFDAPTEPPWTLRSKDAPPIALFYSFKGGAGRSTALAATALHLAAAGERVAVLDADLDAPGVGTLLAGYDGAVASCGITDYLLEQRILGNPTGIDTEDYHHRYAPDGGRGAGEIVVCPAGRFDSRYMEKLARIDYGESPDGRPHPFVVLLQRIREDLSPSWILIDARAGLGDVSGFLTGGLCHFHVLLGTLADASWRGLELILERLGGDRVRQGSPQAECVLVASMVPRSDEALFRGCVERFTDRAREAFSEYYYAEPETPDDFWTLDDLESADAPHVPVVLPYDERLATFRDLGEVAEPILLGSSYAELFERLRAGFRRSKGRGR